jgi:7-cyano-7-deazaguanine synthase
MSAEVGNVDTTVAALYRLPLAEFVAARHQLARRLRTTGDRQAAQPLGLTLVALWVNVGLLWCNYTSVVRVPGGCLGNCGGSPRRAGAVGGRLGSSAGWDWDHDRRWAVTDESNAVVLLSGGLDSTTTLAIARAEEFRPYALSFRYGQRHVVELDAARRVATTLGAVEHVVVDIDLRLFGRSALTDDLDVPKNRSPEEMDDGIPVTYVPARNTIFLSFALAWAETLEASHIYIGVNALDYSGYPDCRPEYIHAFEHMANLATKAGVEGRQHLQIHTPLIELTKAQIIQCGLELGIDYGLTHSCYDPDPSGRPCGACDSCLLRAKGFKEAGLEDPALPCVAEAKP